MPDIRKLKVLRPGLELGTMKKDRFEPAHALALLALSSCSNSTQQTQEGITSPAIRTIMARRSIRSYKSNPVSRDTLDVILNCGINSANAMNRQSWEIRVVDNASLIDSVTRAFLRVFMGEAPAPRRALSKRPSRVVAMHVCLPQ